MVQLGNDFRLKYFHLFADADCFKTQLPVETHPLLMTEPSRPSYVAS